MLNGVLEKLRRHSPRDVVSHGVRRAAQRVVRVLPMAEKSPTLWKLGLSDETRFWREWLATGGLEWPDDFKARFDADEPLVPEIAELVDSSAERVRILDVGAGPLTCVGKKLDGVEVEIVALDPLADDYDRLLAEAKLTPPVRTIAGHGEKLLDVVEAGSFDIAHARNCLDHSYDPVTAVEQMLAAVRPGGVVLLRHEVDEGENENYAGLHQWNFSETDGHFVIWNKDAKVDMTERLADAATVKAWRDTVRDAPWVMVLITKNAG
jgi:SAM-dependent methyltransferase